MEENKKKGFVPQDEEYYQDNRAELPEIPKLDPIVDPNAGPTAVDEGLKRPASAEPAELTAEQQLARDYAGQISEEADAMDVQINSVADLVALADKERQQRLEADADYQRRENAYRYIAGLGDTLSGLANLVGTAHGAEDQRQTYNAPGVLKTAEMNRKLRAREMEDLDRRLDELRGREADLRSAKSLRDAQLKAQFAKEQRAIRLQQERDALNREKLEQAVEEAELKAEQAAAKLEEQTRSNKAKEATAQTRAATAQQKADTAQQREERLAQGKTGTAGKTGKSLFDSL